MKWGVLIVFILFCASVIAHPRDSSKMIEKQRAKIERQKKRVGHKWDERSVNQRKTDRRVLIFMAISAAVLVNTVAVKE